MRFTLFTLLPHQCGEYLLIQMTLIHEGSFLWNRVLEINNFVWLIYWPPHLHTTHFKHRKKGFSRDEQDIGLGDENIYGIIKKVCTQQYKKLLNNLVKVGLCDAKRLSFYRFEIAKNQNDIAFIICFLFYVSFFHTCEDLIKISHSTVQRQLTSNSGLFLTAISQQ